MLQELICSSAEVLPPASPNVVVLAAASSDQTNGQGQESNKADDVYRLTTEALLALHRTVVALHLFAKYEQKSKRSSSIITDNNYTLTTNTKPHNDDDTDEYNILSDSHRSGSANVRPSSLSVASHILPSSSSSSSSNYPSDVVRTRRRDHSQINNGDSNSSPSDSDFNAHRWALQSSKTKKRKIVKSTRKSFGNGGTDSHQLIGIAEECEYDSDVGKFNCDADDDDNDEDTNDKEQPLSQTKDDDHPPPTTQPPTEIAFNQTNCLHANGITTTTPNNNKEELFAKSRAEEELHYNLNELNSRKQSTLLCAGGFILTLVLLFLFPLPD